MAGTLFPRSYIIERIDARLASIASREAEDTVKVAKGIDAGHALWIEHAFDLNMWAMKLSALAGDIVTASEAGTLAVDQVEAKVRDLGTKAPQDPAERWDRNATSSQRKLGTAVSEGQRADSRLTEAARERNQLDHVRAYLLDAPVETFTKTDLRDLNLLSVVAFRLDAPRG